MLRCMLLVRGLCVSPAPDLGKLRKPIQRLRGVRVRKVGILVHGELDTSVACQRL